MAVTSAGRTALRPEPLELGAAIPASVTLHALVLALIVGWDLVSGPTAPLINPDDVMEVTMVALPKQTTELQQKETRVERPPDPPKEQEPEPVADADLDPPEEEVEAPPETVDMPDPEASPEVTQKEVAKKVDHSARRKALLARMKKQALLDAMREEDIPVGDEERLRTDKEGVEGATGQHMNQLGDPELAAYIEKLRQVLQANFSPIQTDPLSVWVDVVIDASGNIKDWSKIEPGSGNASFDAAAVRAVMKTRKVPAPPEKYREQAARAGLRVRFSNE